MFILIGFGYNILHVKLTSTPDLLSILSFLIIQLLFFFQDWFGLQFNFSIVFTKDISLIQLQIVIFFLPKFKRIAGFSLTKG